MIKIENLFEYFSIKIPNFQQTKKGGIFLFTCCNINNHKIKSNSPTMTIILGSGDRISCLICGWKGNFFDSVRLIEEKRRNQSDAQITEYLINEFKVDMYPELEAYKKYKWTLVPVAKESKSPIEKNWTNITHYEKVDWIKWLNNNLNLGVRTGEVSGITVIDVDTKEVTLELQTQKDELIKLLVDSKTLMQNSPHGKHYVFKYDKDIPQTVDMAGLKIDTRNDGGQILVQPSRIEALNYTWINLGEEIKEIPEDLKVKLLQLLKVDKGRKEETSQDLSQKDTTIYDGVKIVGEGNRNSLLTSIGGLLINKLSAEQTEFVLNVISHNFMKPALPGFEIKNLLGSLTGYKAAEEGTQEQMIYEYLKQMQNDVSAKDVMDSLKLSRAIVDKYLSKFVKEGKAIRLHRGHYKHREKVEWSDKFPTGIKKIGYKIPYFDELQDYEDGDIIVLGGKPGSGKTTTSMNIIKQVIEQGIKPFYIFSESGSRHYRIADKLGISEGKFYHSYHCNPLSIEIEKNSFTILDWLLIEEKEQTDKIFKFFTEEMERKGGILIIMMQLKVDHDWYAPNMITQFPALAARYKIDSEDRKTGHWELDKIRDSKFGYYNPIIQCEFNQDTKLLTIKKDLI